ncbi:MAG TPA: trypsin-like peptidase domain-containing protein [Elusimicrobiales bacterium]|nr:trypsin-like peptidase domain-containing protein [Elusimicrobiales bacterium]
MNLNKIKLAALFSLFTLGTQALAADKIIYGDDDRVDYYAMPESYRWAADSTVSLWKKSNIFLDQQTGTYALATFKFGQAYDLCPGTRFAEQEAGAFCSGALVGEDLVITAGHCIVRDFDCSTAAIVFGFAAKAEGQPAASRAPAGEVYGCSKIIKRQLTDVTTSVDGVENTVFGPDYALIKLDRPVKNHKPLAVNRGGGLRKGDSLFVTGHPLGLPFKFTPSGLVIKNVDAQSAYFSTNLDTFGGNSGSPVFNAATGLIEGIHVRGEGQHFLPTFEGCNTYLVRPPGTGSGGHVTKINFLAADIPALAQETATAAYVGVPVTVPQRSAVRMELPAPGSVRFDF